ncbi:MAG: DUF5919 domain-containing protein [Micromonosporaceae bacterium]
MLDAPRERRREPNYLDLQSPGRCGSVAPASRGWPSPAGTTDPSDETQPVKKSQRGPRRGNIELAVYDETVRNNIILVNDDLCVAQPYLNDARGLDSPTFVIERRWRDRGLFRVYENVFTSLWKSGRQL